ncbi:MAG: conjugal transfer protein TrbF [Azospirillum sp.]|nr:conjugal transfer protein TrbF [Azospirillum sp.]
MLFKRPLQRYGETPAPVTPYQKAAQLWDERIGSARVQARNWRLMAFGCFGLSLGLAGGLIWQSQQSRVVPYVVEVNQLGEVRAVSPAGDAYQPRDQQIAWHLARLVTDLRSLSTDPVLVRRQWLEAYDFVTGPAVVFLNDSARSNDPFAAVGTRSVSVEVTSVVRASDSSFQVKWVEQVYERGALARTERWTAILGVAVQPPRTAEALRKNPLGLFVNAIAWSRDLDTAAPSNGRTSP